MTGRSYPGFFLVVDGINGSGKTTVCENVQVLLNRRKVPTLRTGEPTNNEVGSLIRRILKKEIPKPSEDAMAHLFVADRMLHVEQEILPALQEGRVVICDRYSSSTVAYQGEEGSFLWAVDLHKRVLKSDLLAILDPPLKVALERISKRTKMSGDPVETYEYTEKLQAAHKGFWAVATTPGILAAESAVFQEDYKSAEIPAQIIVNRVLSLWKRRS